MAGCTHCLSGNACCRRRQLSLSWFVRRRMSQTYTTDGDMMLVMCTLRLCTCVICRRWYDTARCMPIGKDVSRCVDVWYGPQRRKTRLLSDDAISCHARPYASSLGLQQLQNRWNRWTICALIERMLYSLHETTCTHLLTGKGSTIQE